MYHSGPRVPCLSYICTYQVLQENVCRWLPCYFGMGHDSGKLLIWQTQKHALYAQYAPTTESLTPHFISQQRTVLRLELVIFLMYHCSLWCVKLSILLFFRRLQQGQSIRKQKIWWWCVLSFTVATWVISIGLVQYQCLVRSFEWIARKCNSSLAISKPFSFDSQLLFRPPSTFSMEGSPCNLRRGRAFWCNE